MSIYSCLSALFLSALLAGCTQFPELDSSQTPGVFDAPYPQLVPLDDLINGAPPRATADMIGSVTGRAAGLRARAVRIKRLPVGPSSGTDRRVAQLRQKAAQLRAQ
ncbi:hypothetical protein [Pelagimonas varians]|uniref:Uncharacterized protein n=1 Tax=Pelagimonas varians TaxID=696760 RepID=A0A238KW50_9RHOB|nr:hypothetical protein [Pelagimonas varians]PYG28062.1 hypothetical protein C8N36_11394 [Pelagimonas varians]SMX46870.1 hypothetical protein PEV8663_03408 [Pelagimonas varians]